MSSLVIFTFRFQCLRRLLFNRYVFYYSVVLTRKLIVELFCLTFSHQKLELKIYFMNRIPTLRISKNEGVLVHFNATSKAC